MKKNLQLILLLIVILNIPACFTRDYDEDLLIYFVRTGNIYQISEKGENLKLLLGGATYNYPCVSPDGKYLLCRMTDNSVIYNLETMSVYKDFGAIYSYTHSWSPDGTKIAGTIASGYVAVYDIATGSQIWNGGGGGKTGHYFTNDSQYIAETNGLTLNEYIHTSGADTIADRSHDLQGTFYNLTLSPESDYIAGNNGGNIYLIPNTETYTFYPQLLTTGTQPSWSPDGENLVYVNGGNLYIYNIDAGSSRQLTFSGTDSYPCYQYKPR